LQEGGGNFEQLMKHVSMLLLWIR